MTTEQVHINKINSGDAIIHNGKMVTVSNNNIKHCSFMGRSLFGDSYHAGHKLVTRVVFKIIEK